MAISWKIEKITDCNNEACNWVSVQPSQGEGDSSPKVTVTAATSPDDCATAYITISASTGQKQELSVIRCLPECSCKSLKFEKTPITEPQPAAGATHLQIGTYDNSSACLDGASISVGGIFTNPSSGEGKIYADVTENTTTSPKTGFFRFMYNGSKCVESEITQEGKANPCAAAACPSVTVTKTSFGPQGGTGSYSIEGNLDCYRSSVSSYPNNWITIYETNKTFNVASTKASRTGQINFVFTNISTSVQCPTTTISITQSGVPPTPTCNCEDLKLTGDTISYEGKDRVQIGSFTTTCVENISVTASTKDWVTNFSVDINNGKIFAKVTENESTEYERTSTITVTGKTDTGNCEKTFVVTQNKKIVSCTTCKNANIQNLNDKTIDASGSGTEAKEIGSFSYDCDPGLTAKRDSGKDFITNMTVSKGKVYGTVSANTETTKRSETIGIYVGTSRCAQYTLTQQGATPVGCYVNVKDKINVNDVNVVYKVLNSNDEQVGILESTSLSTTERRINLQGNTEGTLKVKAEYDSASMYKQISQSTSTGRCSSTIECECSRTVNILGKLIESTRGDSKCYKLGTFKADHALFNNLVIIYAPYFWNGSAWETGNDINVYFNKEESEESENIEHCYGNCTWTHCHPCNNVPQGCFASYSKCIIKGGTVIGKKCEYTDTASATNYILTYEEPF